MATDELSFESAEQLFEALGVPDAMARRRVLGWVATHPAEAIALGPVAGRDILDVLFGLINRDWAYPYWQDIAITIGAFDSPRITEFFLDLLATATHSSQAYDAASALERRRGAEGLRERLAEIVTGDGPPERIAAAAQVLADGQDLPEEAAIRVSLLEDEVDAPRITDRNAARWLSELDGPFGEQARDLLELQGPDAVRVVAAHWADLAGDDRGWLLEWAGEAVPGDPVTAELVRRGLQPEDDDVALAALECAAMLPDGALEPDELAPWADHERPELRAAAITAGAPADLESLLSGGETEPEVLVAVLGRLATGRSAEAAEAVAAQLGSESVEVRNTARDAMVSLGAEAIARLRPLVHSDSPEVRAGAVRALLDLGDDEWLAGELLEGRSG
ncbi:MAG: hypothetical protein ACRDL6_02270 [Solirubrobacterales bacterium]